MFHNIKGSFRPPHGSVLNFADPLFGEHKGLFTCLLVHMDGVRPNLPYFVEALIDGTPIGISRPAYYSGQTSNRFEDMYFRFEPSLFVGQQVVEFRYFYLDHTGHRIDLEIAGVYPR